MKHFIKHAKNGKFLFVTFLFFKHKFAKNIIY